MTVSRHAPLCTICIRTFSGIWKGKPFDRLEFFKRNMQSIFENTHVDYEVWIVDDCSTQQSQIDYLAEIEEHPRVHIYRKEKNMGRQHSFALQRYLGYASESPYVYICDDDYEYRSGWLGRLIGSYEMLQRLWEGKRPIGLLSGFHREGFREEAEFSAGHHRFGWTKKWLGCRWLMAREVIKNGGGHDETEPLDGWPTSTTEKWTSPWIDDGSYQMRLSEAYGYEHAFVLMETPSLVEHIGTRGVHSRPNKHVWGAK